MDGNITPVMPIGGMGDGFGNGGFWIFALLILAFMGGGFGGCTVAIVENDAVENFKEVVGKAYKEKFDIDAEFYVVDIGDGARRLA